MASERFEIIWSPQAKKDFLNTLDYLSKEWNPKVVDKLVRATDYILNIISQAPKTFRVINKKRMVRKCNIVRQLALIYRVEGNAIQLVTFFDNRQDPKKLKRIIQHF